MQCVRVDDPYPGYADGWTVIQDETGRWAANIRNGIVQALIPHAEWLSMLRAAEQLEVNSSGDLVHGCSLCVLADYLGQTTQDLLEGARDEPERLQLLHRLEQSGAANDVIDLFKAYGVYLADESFDNHAAMMQELNDNPSDWDGALAWDGHIIRARQLGPKLDFWDPQSGLDERAIPTAGRLILVTFHA